MSREARDLISKWGSIAVTERKPATTAVYRTIATGEIPAGSTYSVYSEYIPIAYDPYAQKLYRGIGDIKEAAKLATSRIIYLQDREGPTDDIMEQMETQRISAGPRERVKNAWDQLFSSYTNLQKFRPQLDPA